jgi:hypothetical protein
MALGDVSCPQIVYVRIFSESTDTSIATRYLSANLIFYSLIPLKLIKRGVTLSRITLEGENNFRQEYEVLGAQHLVCPYSWHSTVRLQPTVNINNRKEVHGINNRKEVHGTLQDSMGDQKCSLSCYACKKTSVDPESNRVHHGVLLVLAVGCDTLNNSSDVTAVVNSGYLSVHAFNSPSSMQHVAL